jgi:hypothetical protein
MMIGAMLLLQLIALCEARSLQPNPLSTDVDDDRIDASPVRPGQTEYG